MKWYAGNGPQRQFRLQVGGGLGDRPCRVIGFFYPAYFSGIESILRDQGSVEKLLRHAYPLNRLFKFSRSFGKHVVKVLVLVITDIGLLAFVSDVLLVLKRFGLPDEVESALRKQPVGALHLNIPVDHIIIAPDHKLMRNDSTTNSALNVIVCELLSACWSSPCQGGKTIHQLQQPDPGRY